jgi:hypothetical protein
MRLKFVQKVSFRSSEQSNWLAFTRSHRDVAATLREGDAICFLSQGEDQIVFVHGFDAWEDEAGKTVQVLATSRLRISTKWDPLMLANYAEKVGLRLDGLKRFEDYFKELTK